MKKMQQCDKCDFKAPLKTHLKRHINIRHKESCHKCDIKALIKPHLNRDTTSVHE